MNLALLLLLPLLRGLRDGFGGGGSDSRQPRRKGLSMKLEALYTTSPSPALTIKDGQEAPCLKQADTALSVRFLRAKALHQHPPIFGARGLNGPGQKGRTMLSQAI